MRLEELPVSVAEMQTLSSEPLEFPMRDKHGNRLASARQFDFDASFGLVDDTGEAGSGFSYRVPSRHTLSVHRDVHERKTGRPYDRVTDHTAAPALSV